MCDGKPCSEDVDSTLLGKEIEVRGEYGGASGLPGTVLSEVGWLFPWELASVSTFGAAPSETLTGSGSSALCPGMRWGST